MSAAFSLADCKAVMKLRDPYWRNQQNTEDQPCKEIGYMQNGVPRKETMFYESTVATLEIRTGTQNGRLTSLYIVFPIVSTFQFI